MIDTLKDVDISAGTAPGLDNSWTVQNSSKTRRLTPQVKLTRNDLGVDSPRNIAHQQSQQSQQSQQKKPMSCQYTKEDILKLRDMTKVLSTMIDLTDIMSIDPLDPVCLDAFEQDEVYRIWNADRIQKNENVRTVGSSSSGGGVSSSSSGGVGVGNSVGTVRRNRRDDDDSDRWARGTYMSDNNRGHNDGGWDDNMNSMGGGLEDFAAAASKFRSETKDLGLNDYGPKYSDESDMALDRLIQEQNANNNDIGDAAVDYENDDNEDMPEWADNDDSNGSSNNNSSASTEVAATKRSLLLGALHKGTTATPTAEPIGSVAATMNKISFNDIMTSSSASLIAPITSVYPSSSSFINTPIQSMQQHFPIVPMSAPIEWLYLDPNHIVQGPFDTDSMKIWFQGGYFQADLLIKLKTWIGFYPLGVVYPLSTVAFNSIPVEPKQQPQPVTMQEQSRIFAIQQAMREQQMLEQQRLEQQRIEQQTLLEQQRIEQQRMEQQRMEQQRMEQQRIEQQRMEQQRMEQQRMEQQRIEQQQLEQQRMEQQQLEQQRMEQQRLEQQHRMEQQQKLELQRKAAAAAAKPAWGSAPVQAVSSKSLSDIQAEEAKQAAVLNASPKVGVWGASVATAAPAAGPSLADIQAEEARQLSIRKAAEVQQVQQMQALSNNGSSAQLKSLLGLNSKAPAVVAAAGVPGWGVSANSPKTKANLKDIMQEEVKHVTSDASSKASVNSWAALAVNSGQTTKTAGWGVAPVPAPTVKSNMSHSKGTASTTTASSTTAAAPATTTSTAAAAVSKSTTLPKDMAEWCLSQLKKINGSDDLTLLEFCVSLTSAVEIRETFAMYLGSTPQVSQFATEFIRKYKEPANASSKKR